MSTVYSKTKSIFIETVKNCSPEEWGAYLDRACEGDAQLRQRVQDLLRAHEEKDDFLDRPDPRPEEINQQLVTEAPGRVIGPYQLLDQIGEGGMGLVFVAEQHQPVRRKVALKIIKPGMATRDVIA